MRVTLNALELWIAFMLAVVGGGYVNATVGPAGVAVYGLAVCALIVGLALRSRRRDEFR
jgi:hypothetical protein